MNYSKMSLNELKHDLIVEGKKGYPFFLAGTLYWLAMGVLRFIIDSEEQLALIYLLASCSIFPLAIMISKVFKVNIFSKNPLGVLGGIVGGIQAFYLPVWIVIYMEHYEWLPMAIGILGASHFLPYLWIYQSKTYGIFTVALAVLSFVFGYIFIDQAFSTLPFLLAIMYLITALLLILETKKHIARSHT